MTDSPHPVRLRGTVLGEGRPKICVPLVAATVDDLAAAAAALPFDVVDVVELRIDFFDDVDDDSEVEAAIDVVRGALPDETPLLFTFRSKPEGGQRDIDPDRYVGLLLLAAGNEAVDAIDVEMFTELGPLERIVNGAHELGCAVVMSSHDFEHTPHEEQIVARLLLQQDLGADVVKIAVMPESPRDVLTLLTATAEYVATKGVRPAITMAMGPLGVVSRLAGETFGSCLTFGSAGAASAPGQVDAVALRQVLDVVHEAQ
ncbi:type I 3-dehydroquinate dehydratase [Frondihabitans australicus]|uniref:3-dehydroquinate dehydratase n=1 Tax=Frondihabitans australicus TaxID=386892 RepID=A0A495IL07_9MICO|nr:type I 3-dehydroquinate dehydratase [Frondihabitans australicus]RKR76667.1 3-dehydroquinate dehydratase [Frondihabitans australicus]